MLASIKPKKPSLVERQIWADLYVELMRHNQEDEDRVNPVLISLAQKHAVKLVATNNTYYIIKKMPMHMIFYCV